MLVLTRKMGEKIIIKVPSADGAPPQRIEVQLVLTKLGRAKIGVTCDPSIDVLREELEPTWETKERGHYRAKKR